MDPGQVLTAAYSAYSAYSCQHGVRERSTRPKPPRPGSTRRAPNHNDRRRWDDDTDQFVKEAESKDDETVLYLAYGSNLSNETFRGKRGIRPLSQINVQVPTMRLTFDLPGIPYVEPCFANTAKRDANDDAPAASPERVRAEKPSPLLEKASDRRNAWHKGLLGVVYQVTAADYAHIIASEGGGSSYKDILVDCFALPAASPWDAVPQNPHTKPFKAHTLFAPATPEGEESPDRGGRFQRPRPEYAQASARYLKLITDGAAECGLPYEYQEYLQGLQPYTPTAARQRIGGFTFMVMWAPLVFVVIFGSRIFADQDGSLPSWLQDLTGTLFKAVWASYDHFFRPIFGDGERTTDGGDAREEKEQ